MKEVPLKLVQYLFYPGIIVAVVYARLVWGLWDGYRHLDEFYHSDVTGAMAVWHIRWVVSVLGLVVLNGCIGRSIKQRILWKSFNWSWFSLRLLLYMLFAAVVITSIAYGCNFLGESRFLLRSFFNSALLGCLGLWSVLVIGRPFLIKSPGSGPGRLADVVMANIVITLLLLEVGLHFWAKYSSSTVFQDTASIKSSINRNRQAPYFNYFGFHFNSQGYHDTEFFAAKQNDFVVGLIADSFGMGVVPYAYNFATVTERNLRKVIGKEFKQVAVHNFGIPCVGMNEYDYIMRTEVIKTKPRLIVLCVFAGNDISSGWQPKRNLYAVQKWWTGIIFKRLLMVSAEINKGGAVLDIGRQTGGPGEIPGYIHDSTKEKPSFSEEKFLEIESRRFEICNPQNKITLKHFTGFFRAFIRLRVFTGDRLLVVLIPDEFQVNDALYGKLLKTKTFPENYIRDYPQQRIRSFCREKNILLLDLLNDLRSAEKTGRTYHLRDTHWNAKGNRVAGEAIAKSIIDSGLINSRFTTKQSRNM